MPFFPVQFVFKSLATPAMALLLSPFLRRFWELACQLRQR